MTSASIVDGALLVDMWNELVLPRRLRAACQPFIDAVMGSGLGEAGHLTKTGSGVSLS